MTTETVQPGNEIWIHDPNDISPVVNITDTPNESVIPDEKFKWFQVVMPNGGDTDQEKSEQHNAQMEQLRLGILKLQQSPQLPPTQMNFHGGMVSQPVQIGQTPQFQPFPNKQPLSPISNKYLDNVFGTKKKIGPNDPCSCGSGKKYKKCHGRGI